MDPALVLDRPPPKPLGVGGGVVCDPPGQRSHAVRKGGASGGSYVPPLVRRRGFGPVVTGTFSVDFSRG